MPPSPSCAPTLDVLFAQAMARFAPFERRPQLAVAYSGGPDSGATLRLSCAWAQARGGAVTALIVDHGLRATAAAEAAQAAAWARALGAEAMILRPSEPIDPSGDVMAGARAARYRLLLDACAERGILHVILGHHRDDQAETLALRLARGSGLRGLAAMRPVVDLGPARLLRPLLAVPRADLIADLLARGVPFIEDPSNGDLRFARPRVRQLLALRHDGDQNDAAIGSRLAQTAALLTADAEAQDHALADLAARVVAPHPAGCARLDAARWRLAPSAVRLRLLADLLGWIGGAVHAPRLERLERLAEQLASAGTAPLSATLAGCRIRRCSPDGALWIGREAAAQAPDAPLTPGRTARWDGRFALAVPGDAPTGWRLGPLGDARPQGLASPPGAPPRWLWPTLPVLRHLDQIVAIPHLSYCRSGRSADTMLFGALRPDPFRPFLPFYDGKEPRASTPGARGRE